MNIHARLNYTTIDSIREFLKSAAHIRAESVFIYKNIMKYVYEQEKYNRPYLFRNTNHCVGWSFAWKAARTFERNFWERNHRKADFFCSHAITVRAVRNEVKFTYPGQVILKWAFIILLSSPFVGDLHSLYSRSSRALVRSKSTWPDNNRVILLPSTTNYKECAFSHAKTWHFFVLKKIIIIK